ncbi:MAG: bifunctional 5,10-methylenetetrahydrofolate dehydrogenase/5,10-methenyltetrahydrofolate cyclohydrolase [Candidatus Omnitrophota bacterium]|nr:bifunctional 5,10-methylenetetrahydrofolate dehydrogenase/5,10-methenyltetrahydrofolate cyclohydrolase [Candidatus Omnitrophota bacterium]MBU2528414.1 bifunctional 5,10-methylenetetrahydrofolate dehydrogenase/5,10-methenyltetrahydrofolate cyclohydrolase [bacterium]MBU3930672.1 bifunctional 5,10-methylenetetrahydrofolate dehydrogenase/5,10-methenyltetrahydrofolate cyclohydrolase [bacterium]MBU4123475.1 bifunctional 5,10-methylenetetrahydrofolate dehydrogenase/5,10-methenyltetrahydrofolate cycl
MGEIIDGKRIASEIKEEIRKSQLKPKLVAVQVGENPASRVYVNNQKKAAEELGIGYELVEMDVSTSADELKSRIEKLNTDISVNGIILQMPLPAGLDAKDFQAIINPLKDVEGLNPANLGKIVLGEIGLAPCTAMAVWEIIKRENIDIKGKEAVIVGHSSIVGKPVNMLLLSSLNESATTTCCHIATKDLAFHTKRADILIVAAGKAGLIKGEMIKEGAVVIDVGINRVPVLDEKGEPVLNENGKPKKKTVGDVEYETALERAGRITPVPGGVGPVTTAILFKNLLYACSLQK